MGCEVTNNFNDTSEYIYRNSSLDKAGFKVSYGDVDTDTTLDVEGTEDISQTQTLLTAADQEQIRGMIDTLTICTTEQLCQDKSDLMSRANLAWNRALALYPEYRIQLQADLDDLRAERHAYICLMEQQWARTAGSSLNCLVQGMRNKAEVELARVMAQAIAESNRRMKEHETEALRNAFEKELTARMEPVKTGLNQIGTLFSVLRGATLTDITDRDYTEHRNEEVNQHTLLGDFYHEAQSTAENSGTYAGEVSALASIAQAILGPLG